ncbi:hypothetical protein [Acidianus sp. HS-5]|uniref:hypothetical protein n=1 Tax=Acidianus sp. HS-5 TaxID=2886040 RepID=UPI001F488B27|nr:hypothetical protein [Acidianus sp. HS-5]BDC18236.1 hypothetical protein HS5_11260 [Acidianus sp. HS-5]
MEEESTKNYVCQRLNNFRGDLVKVYIVQKGNKEAKYTNKVYRTSLKEEKVNQSLLKIFRTNIDCLCNNNSNDNGEEDTECPSGELGILLKNKNDNIYTDNIVTNTNIGKLNRELKHKLVLLLHTRWVDTNKDNIECSYHLFIGINIKKASIIRKGFLAPITGNFDKIEEIIQINRAIIIPEIGDFLILYEICGKEVKKFYITKIKEESKNRLEQKMEYDLNLIPENIAKAKQIIDSIKDDEWSKSVFSNLSDEKGNSISINKDEAKQMAENSHIRTHILDPDTIIWLRYSKTPDILVNRLREENRLSDVLEVKNGKLVLKRTNKVEIVQELLRILRQNYGLPIFPSARGVIGSRKGGFADLVREIIVENNGEIGRGELKNKLYDKLEPFMKRVLDPDGRSQRLGKDVYELIEIILGVLKNSKIIYEDNDKIRLQTQII